MNDDMKEIVINKVEVRLEELNEAAETMYSAARKLCDEFEIDRLDFMACLVDCVEDALHNEWSRLEYQADECGKEIDELKRPPEYAEYMNRSWKKHRACMVNPQTIADIEQANLMAAGLMDTEQLD